MVFSAFNVRWTFTAILLYLLPPPNYLNPEAPGTTPCNIQISTNYETHTHTYYYITPICEIMIYSKTEGIDDGVTSETSLICIGTLPTVTLYTAHSTMFQQQTAFVFRWNYDLKNKLTSWRNQLVQFKSNRQIIQNSNINSTFQDCTSNGADVTVTSEGHGSADLFKFR